jgi:pSer/pThr/pTyr-binding forkhead associated (FHA) protein
MTRLEAEPGNASLGSARKTVLIGEERQPALVGWLVVMDGEDRGKDYRLREGQNILGSGGSVDVVIADKTISTKHASVRYRDRKFLLTDLDSTNGTYLNDNAEAISREELRDNDLLRLGGVCLRFKRL